MKTISVQMPDGMYDYVDRVAKSQLTNKASVVRRILLEHVKEKAPEALQEPNQQALNLEPQAA